MSELKFDFPKSRKLRSDDATELLISRAVSVQQYVTHDLTQRFSITLQNLNDLEFDLQCRRR